MIKIKRIIPALIVLSVVVAGCTPAVKTSAVTTTTTVNTSGETKAAPKDDPSKMVPAEDLNKLKKEFEDFKAEKNKEISKLNKTIEDLLKSSKIEDNNTLAFKDRLSGMLYFPIVSKNPDNMEETVLAYVAIEPQLSVEDKISKLTKALSSTRFNSLPITTKITEDAGKKILKVDLIGRENWSQMFQGSTGGGINSYTIIETYLQKSFKNAWIDAVEVTVDGKAPRFEHAPSLDGTNERKN